MLLDGSQSLIASGRKSSTVICRPAGLRGITGCSGAARDAASGAAAGFSHQRAGAPSLTLSAQCSIDGCKCRSCKPSCCCRGPQTRTQLRLWPVCRAHPHRSTSCTASGASERGQRHAVGRQARGWPRPVHPRQGAGRLPCSHAPARYAGLRTAPCRAPGAAGCCLADALALVRAQRETYRLCELKYALVSPWAGRQARL